MMHHKLSILPTWAEDMATITLSEEETGALYATASPGAKDCINAAPDWWTQPSDGSGCFWDTNASYGDVQIGAVRVKSDTPPCVQLSRLQP
jgi:hypothetical protein